MTNKQQQLISAIVIIVLAFCLVLWAHFSMQRKTTGTLYLKGLHGPVMIYRDHDGVPHVVASKNDMDAYFALGYVHAQDRLWQMTFQKHVASGTLSEIFGKKTLKEDEVLRTWGFYRAAQSAWLALDANTKAVVKSYTAGVNAYIASHQLPLQFKLVHFQPKPWTVIDSIAWQKMMAWHLQNAWLEKLNNAILMKKFDLYGVNYFKPPYPENAPTVLSAQDLLQSHLTLKAIAAQKPIHNLLGALRELRNDLPFTNTIRKSLGFREIPGQGSNAWVVSGRMSVTGKPLLADDPHLGLQAPSIWYLAELKGPHFHVMGATVPGLPGVIIGHNDHIAWGVTNGGSDAQDLYVLPKTAKVHTLIETIQVKDASPVQFPVQLSKYGPIISAVDPRIKKMGVRLAIRWTALLPGDTTVESFIKLDDAKNWYEFKKALSYMVAPTQSFVYADTQGNIGYYYAGRVPIRSSGWTGLMPVQPDVDHRWLGFVAFRNLPHVYNPKSGYIISANNKVVPDSYPYQLTYRWRAAPYRAMRLHQLLLAPGKSTVKRFKAMQLDTLSLFWLAVKPSLLHVVPLDQRSQVGLAILKKWDGQMRLHSVGATVFAYWIRDLSALMPTLSELGSPRLEPIFIERQLHYPQRQAFIRQSLQKAMTQLYEDRGPNESNWQWGDVHQAVFNEVGLGKVKSIAWIWRRQIAAPGGDFTVNVGRYAQKNFQETVAASYRQIINLANLSDSYYIQTLGQSESPSTGNYADLLSLWRDGDYLPMRSQTLHCQQDQKTCLVLLPNG